MIYLVDSVIHLSNYQSQIVRKNFPFTQNETEGNHLKKKTIWKKTA